MPLKRFRYGSQIVLHVAHRSELDTGAAHAITVIGRSLREGACNRCRGVGEPGQYNAAHKCCVVQIPANSQTPIRPVIHLLSVAK